MVSSVSVARLLCLLCWLLQVELVIHSCSRVDGGSSNSSNTDDDTLIERHNQTSKEIVPAESESGAPQSGQHESGEQDSPIIYLSANRTRSRQQMRPPMPPVPVRMPLPGVMMRQQVPPTLMLQPQLVPANGISSVVQPPPPPPPPQPPSLTGASLAASLPQLFMAASQPPPPGADEGEYRILLDYQPHN